MTNKLILSPSKNLQTKIIAIAVLFIAVIAISFAAIFIKWSEVELSANATTFNRFWIGTIIFLFWNSFNFVYLKLSSLRWNQESRKDNPYTKNVILLLLALGFSALISQLLWVWSITQISIAISTIFHNLTPIFTTLTAWLLFNKRFEEKFLIGMAIAIVGIMIVSIQDILQIASGKISGEIAALFSAVFYAVYLLIVEQLRTKLNATTLLMWSCLTGTILILPVLIVTGEQLFPYSWEGWLAVISLAFICQFLGQGLIGYSLNKLSAGFVSLFLLIDPVMTAVEAWIIFSENLSLLELIAFLLVLLGIYLALSSQSSIHQE
ncbi:MAG: EamA family transporter [Cyanobacteria bacterium SBLK]|nr:EamA family transporter [Cyanobacteria bacterium SBLK]